MNVAFANTVGVSSTAFMAARGAESGSLGVETRTPSEAVDREETQSAPSARYPVVALSFDQSASHLVMLFRDPESGEAVAQIPSKVVVKQYREAQNEQRREEQRKFELVVGGESDSGSGGTKASGDKTAPSTGAGTPSGFGSSDAGGSSATPGAAGGGAWASGGVAGATTSSSTGGPAAGSSGGFMAAAGAGGASPVGGGSVASINVVV